MSRVPNPSRRALIRNGALTLTAGALAAACGDRGGSNAPGRLGVADAAPELIDEDVDDVTLMRTAQSLEHTAIEVYDEITGRDALSADERALVERFAEAHRRDADAIAAVVTSLGGEPFECGNLFLRERAVGPIVDALEGSDDLRSDLLNVAYAVEQLVGASHQSIIGMLEDKALRATTMTIGSGALRRAAALAVTLDADAYFSPTLSGDVDATDARGIALRYAVPSVFGQVSGIEVTVGGVNDEGSRFSTQLQTPAANTLVYSDATC